MQSKTVKNAGAGMTFSALEPTQSRLPASPGCLHSQSSIIIIVILLLLLLKLYYYIIHMAEATLRHIPGTFAWREIKL